MGNFTIEICFDFKDRKGIKNKVGNHLSLLEEETILKLLDELEIDDAFSR